jgi:hypothetical protein
MSAPVSLGSTAARSWLRNIGLTPSAAGDTYRISLGNIVEIYDIAEVWLVDERSNRFGKL